MAELAITSILFLTIVIGTVDVGRSIYRYGQLNNGVREAAREAKAGETNRLGLSGATMTYSCTGGCKPGDQLTIDAGLPFTAVTQSVLGIGPITLRASATVVIE